MSRATLCALSVFLALAGSGCDLFGPSGPGTVSAIFRGPQPLGGIVVEVTGQGIEGFEGLGSTQVLGAVVSAEQGTHRVVAIVPPGADVRVGIRVADLGSEMPRFRVVWAVNPANTPLSTEGIRARVER